MTIETSLKTLSLGRKQTPILRYVPKVRRKEGQSPFSKLLEFKDAELCLEKLKQNMQVLKETCALPLVSLANNQVSKPLKGSVRPSEGAIEHGTFHQEGTVQSYGPNAYKLIAKAGFDLSKPTALDELHTEKTTKKLQGITDAHQKLINEAKGRSLSKAGLGCEPPKSIRIHGKKKDHSASIQHISVEIIDEVKTPPKPAFQNSNRVSVFNRLGDTSTSRVSVFARLEVPLPNRSQIPRRKSVFDRLNDSRISQESFQKTKNSCDEFKDVKEVRSLIPSRMKRCLELQVDTDGPLRIKRRVVVHTKMKLRNHQKLKLKKPPPP
ncbi:hypothetical protein COLO4_20437 [Corchorus olitorius]|uniref:Uncharacterized protein n=1 Tax=Corchorus olitorius TaxID=93759 RepID=A0A1R3IZW4_9ROSI|nr:hypothetical protein COLO4_20437 [Corchorus olitorius]